MEPGQATGLRGAKVSTPTGFIHTWVLFREQDTPPPPPPLHADSAQTPAFSTFFICSFNCSSLFQPHRRGPPAEKRHRD